MTEAQALDFIAAAPVGGYGIRVPMKMARKWLLEDKALICGGLVFHLEIRNLGLGVCEVKRAPLQIGETKVVKKG
jgi:hypothetical protein